MGFHIPYLVRTEIFVYIDIDDEPNLNEPGFWR
jgi:hypothetical protein